MMVFTLAFSSTEVLADGPSGNDGAEKVDIDLVRYDWVKQSDSDLYVYECVSEQFQVTRGATLDDTLDNVKATLPNVSDVSEDMQFAHDWSVCSFDENDADCLYVAAYALYTDGTREPSTDVIGREVNVEYLTRNTAGTYTEDPITGEHIPDNNTFFESSSHVMIPGKDVTDKEVETKLNSKYVNAVDQPVAGWTITGYDDYKEHGTPSSAKAKYNKKSVNVWGEYASASNYWSQEYIYKGVWVDEITEKNVAAELNKLGLQHDPNAEFQGWTLTKNEDYNSDADALYNAKANYKKQKIDLSATYIIKNEDGTYSNGYYNNNMQGGIYVTDTSDKAIAAELDKLNLNHGLECKGWEITSSGSSYHAKAKYDKYPSGLTYVYLDKNNNTVIKKSTKLYPADKKIKEIVNEETSDKRTDTKFGVLEQFPDAVAGDMWSATLVGSYDGYRSELLMQYPILAVSKGYNYSQGKEVKIIASNSATSSYQSLNTSWMYVPDDVDTTDEMVAFLQKKGLMGTLEQYQALVPDVKGFEYLRMSNMGGIMVTYANGSPSIEYNLSPSVDPSANHTLSDPKYKWSEDHKTCQVTYTCDGKNCGAGKPHTITYNCKVDSHVTKKATCTAKGSVTYTATSTAPGKSKDTNSVTVAIDPIKHTYGKPVFTWSADGKTCKATYTCTGCKKKVTSKCKVTSKVKTKATCTKKGVTTYTATSGKYSSPKNVADIPMIAHTLVTKTTPATAKADGKIDKVCSVCNKKIKTTKINKITSMKVSNATYNKGQEVKPQVTVLDSKGSTINPKYYTVTYANNKEVGTGSVTVNFKGLYSGKLTKTFAINPKATAVAKASSPKKGQLAVNWKALPVGQTNGYQIQVSANANFKNAKTVSVGQNSKAVNAKTITGLKKGNYYIRIRTVKTDADGKTHYSSWAKYKNAVAVK